MRFNEATALFLNQFDFNNRQIRIDRQYIYLLNEFTLPKCSTIKTIV